MQENEPTTQGKEPVATITILDDSIVTGALIAMGHPVTPRVDENERVDYAVRGDVKSSLAKIYENHPIGSLDVIRGIKLARSMIFNMKGKKCR